MTRFVRGDYVYRQNFGFGRIVDVHPARLDDVYAVDFISVGERWCDRGQLVASTEREWASAMAVAALIGGAT